MARIHDQARPAPTKSPATGLAQLMAAQLQGPQRAGPIGPMLARQTALLSLSALVFAEETTRH